MWVPRSLVEWQRGIQGVSYFGYIFGGLQNRRFLSEFAVRPLYGRLFSYATRNKCKFSQNVLTFESIGIQSWSRYFKTGHFRSHIGRMSWEVTGRSSSFLRSLRYFFDTSVVFHTSPSQRNWVLFQNVTVTESWSEIQGKSCKTYFQLSKSILSNLATLAILSSTVEDNFLSFHRGFKRRIWLRNGDFTDLQKCNQNKKHPE